MGKLGKLLVLVAWLPITSVSLIVCLLLLRSYTHTKEISTLLRQQSVAMIPRTGFQFYAALPQILGSFTTAITKEDARPEILRQFLNKNHSPLEPYADAIVQASDTQRVDFRLITAIAMCESNLGKKMPDGSYNAWGYAIYTGQKQGAEFNDWEHGIEVMAKYLGTKYYEQNLTTPEEIGPIYAPPSVNTGNSWAKCVRQFMEELK